jgi:3-hydroxymyristoyl/3-hydroxydecanoyl-(acyl carrier protein) dehydratase
MSTAGPREAVAGVACAKGDEPGEAKAGPKPLLDLSAIDLAACIHDKAGLERYIPHRGTMSLLDSIVWETPDFKQGIGLKRVRRDEFWVPGHFPEKPIMPGVLQIEAGAQMSCYLYNRRQPGPKVVAFLRIEDACFRSMVEPGDDLYLLCNEVKFSRRRFVSDIQGVVGDRVAFEARITGMQL